MIRAILLGLVLLWGGSVAALDFTPAEIAALLRHGPWPMPAAPDRSNLVSASDPAAAFGRSLFFDRRLSQDGTLACASCHNPATGWADGRGLSLGREILTRNAPGLQDARLWRWFGWDGAADTLWAASLRPILASPELAATPAHVARLVAEDATLSACYARAFGAAAVDVAPGAVIVDVAKALAAFIARLETPRAPFDVFRDGLASGDRNAIMRYPEAAQRGARLFVGRGNCALCHLGPAFSNGEFHDVGVPFFTATGVDPGRYAGILALRASPYSLLGKWNDDAATATGVATRHVEPLHRNFGEFRVPTLRNLTRTAPYMHNGSKATLGEVVRHYSTIDPERLHADGEAILRPLNLDTAEIDDLVAFLVSLSPTAAAPDQPGCGDG